ncbi:MAG: response regulator [Deltaproteobacteria bacterium]|nr:response regulator [Deltaproteobacteria bacterium]
MRTSSTKNREWFNLSLVVIITILLALFSLSIDFIDRLYEFLSMYASSPQSELFIRVLFIWLVITLWTTYRRWRKAIIKQRELENIISSINADVLLVVDKDSNIIMANASVKRLFGYEVDEVINKKPDFVYFERCSKELQGYEMQYALENMGFHIGLATGKNKNGDTFPLEIVTGNRSDNNGAVLLLRDITERKRAEKALQISHDELEQQVKERTAKLIQTEKLKSLGELSGGVAHDFNNVLAAILGRVQLLKTKFKPQLEKQEKRKLMIEMKAGLETIERAAIDGAETVRRIQEFSRKRDDDRNFTLVDINELAVNALEFTQARWKDETEPKGIKIKIKKELSPLTSILGSSSELREVFTNLINNAIDAMPLGGEIKVESFMDDTIAVLRISDTGKGIAKEITKRIFDPFFTTKDVKSTGLGLSVSYGIINRHRGTITVDSIEGEGTTFTIKLPIATETDKGKVKEEKVIPTKRIQKKVSILVIEDEKDVRELLRDILKDAGHRVEVANDGSEGIEIFKKNKFDLVFTDLGMPVMSGWQVAEKIKSINDKIPVVLITGWNVALDSLAINNSGANLIIHKPFKMEQILNLVQDGMQLKNQLKAV